MCREVLAVSLYLCVFDDDTELDGVEVGGYDDFNSFLVRPWSVNAKVEVLEPSIRR